MTEVSRSRKQRYWAIVPAAGIGSRMRADRPKQYLQLAGKTILEYTLECFLTHPLIEATYVAIAEQDTFWRELPLHQHERLIEVQGGQERCHSVYNALLYLLPEAEDEDWVLVHDAARPCLRKADIDFLIESVSEDPVGGILAVPVKDTMKQAKQDGSIEGTVDRERLWHAMTPQMFRVGDLFRATKRALEQNVLMTDEASAMEMSGMHPRLVEGHADNIKVTRPEDMALIQFYLQQQGRME